MHSYLYGVSDVDIPFTFCNSYSRTSMFMNFFHYHTLFFATSVKGSEVKV